MANMEVYIVQEDSCYHDSSQDVLGVFSSEGKALEWAEDNGHFRSDDPRCDKEHWVIIFKEKVQ